LDLFQGWAKTFPGLAVKQQIPAIRSGRMTALPGVENIKLGAENTKRPKKSQAFGMTDDKGEGDPSTKGGYCSSSLVFAFRPAV
jgi:hypothetical protein